MKVLIRNFLEKTAIKPLKKNLVHLAEKGTQKGKHKNRGMQNTKIEKLRNWKVEKCRNTKIQKYKNAK